MDYDRCPNKPYMKHICGKTTNVRINPNKVFTVIIPLDEFFPQIIRLLELKDWIMFGIIGCFTGTVAFAIDTCVKLLTKLKFDFSVCKFVLGW